MRLSRNRLLVTMATAFCAGFAIGIVQYIVSQEA